MIIMIMITIITIIADNDIIPPPHKEQNGFYDFDKYDDYKALFIKIIIIIIVSACPKYFDDYEYDDYGDYDEGITLPSTTKLCSCFDCSSAALNISFASSNSLIIMIMIMLMLVIMMLMMVFATFRTA